MLCRDYCWWRSSPIYYGLSLPEPLFTMSLTSGSVMGDSTTVSDGRANAGCHRGKQKAVSKSAIKSEIKSSSQIVPAVIQQMPRIEKELLPDDAQARSQGGAATSIAAFIFTGEL